MTNQDAADAGEALVQQFAEAMLRASCRHWHRTEADADAAFEAIRSSVGLFESYPRNARAVLPLVEAQVAPLRAVAADLRASVERVLAANETLRVDNHSLRSQVQAVEDELDRERLSQDYKPEGVDIVMGKMQDARRRADAAESALRQVREDLTALADELTRLGTQAHGEDGSSRGLTFYEAAGKIRRRLLGEDHRHSPDETWDGSGDATCAACGIHAHGGVWRAILDSARVGAADEAPKWPRLIVNLHPTTAGALKAIAERDGTNLTEAVRRLVLMRVQQDQRDAAADPTAGSNGDTTPEAVCCGKYDHDGSAWCGESCADAAPESGEGR